MSDLAITAVDWLPLHPRLIKEGYGDGDTVWPADLPCLLVRVTAACGTVGYGEATSQAWYLGETQAQLDSALRLYASALAGLPADNLGAAHRAMLGVYAGGSVGNAAARAAIDTALHDLTGRARGVPVATLLGGALRTRLDQLTNLYHDTPAEMAAGARGFVDRGFRGLKVKIGERLLAHGWSPAALGHELDKLQAVLDAVEPDVLVDADANQGLRNAGSAAAALQGFRGWPNLGIEQPLHLEDTTGHAHLRRTLGLPIVLDEPVRSPEAVLQLIRQDACDRVVIKLNRVGGLHPAARIAAICQAAGVGVSVDTNPFTRLGDTASAHLAATLEPHFPVDCEGHVSFLTLPDRLVTGGVAFADGKAVVPEAPGLGVKVDWDAVAGAA
jgi:muconate cycloisomerase